MLQIGKSSVQCLYRPSQMVTLMSLDVEGASARSFSLASPARFLFPSPPPFRLTDEGAMSAVLDTDGIRREKEKRQQWETVNVDGQEALLGLLSMGFALNHIHFHQDEHQNRHQHYHHHSHMPSSSSPRFDSNVFSTAPTPTILAIERKQIHLFMQSPFERMTSKTTTRHVLRLHTRYLGGHRLHVRIHDRQRVQP